jgi:hypothetical protein
MNGPPGQSSRSTLLGRTLAAEVGERARFAEVTVDAVVRPDGAGTGDCREVGLRIEIDGERVVAFARNPRRSQATSSASKRVEASA